jgi:outer membrane lipoprotein-sorting protein
MRGLLAALLLAGASASAAPASPGTPPSVDQILVELDRASKGVKQLDGEFNQRNRLKLFKQELVSKGRLSFSAPRKIKWEYTTPDPSTLVLDGNTATLTSPGAAPRTFDLEKDATMRAVFDQLLLWIGPGSLARAKDDYQLASGGTAESPALILTPKSTSPIAKAFRRIELRLDGNSWLLRSILLVEQNGDEKEITFTSLRRR